MRTTLHYVLGALMLALVVSVAWWTSLVVEPTTYQLSAGESVVELSRERGVSLEAIAQANDLTVGQLETLGVGETVALPPPAPEGWGLWKVHAVGLVAEIFGVLLSFWLALVAGLLPKGHRRQMLGISAALGLASYAGSHGVVGQAPMLTPEFVFGSIKDGFAWAAAFPLFASAFGMGGPRRDPQPKEKRQTPTPTPVREQDAQESEPEDRTPSR